MMALRLKLVLLIAISAPVALPAQETSKPFDPAAAWDEFETVVRANYAYLADGPDAKWKAQFARSREAASNAATRTEFRRIMHRTALTFGDPHFIVGPFEPSDYNIVFTSSDLDLRLDPDGHYRVRMVRAGSAADVAGIRPGWRVASIDGTAIDQAAVRPYGEVLREPSDAQRAYGATLAENGTRDALARTIVFVLPDGSQRTVRIDNPRNLARAQADLPLLTERRVGAGQDVAHIRINNTLGDDDLIAAFDRTIANAADARAVILDLRNTPSGGNSDIARAIIGHFIEGWRPYQAHTIPAVARRKGVPRYFVEYAAPRPPFAAMPLFVLHGRWTGSMGEGLVIGLDHAAGATTIGSDMGDLLGGLWNFDLALSGARVDLGGEGLFHIDGTPREDFVADHSLVSADRDSDGGDPAMRLALELIEALPPAH